MVVSVRTRLTDRGKLSTSKLRGLNMSNQGTGKIPRKTLRSYGGQAVIEGVMMRGANRVAVAVRNPNGEIVVHEEQLNSWIYQGPISKMPFVRGLLTLWDALGIGMRALMWSAD